MHGKQLRLYLTMGFFTALLILFANLGGGGWRSCSDHD